MHFLQADDVRLHAVDRVGDFLNVIAVDELIVSGDVVSHDDERPLLRRKSDALWKTDELSLLAARGDARRRIDRLRRAFAAANGVDGENAIEKKEREDREDSEKP